MTTPVRSSLPSIFFTDSLPRNYPSVFLYGAAGTGKTNSLRTLQSLNPLVLASEVGNTRGMSTLGDLHMPAILLNSLEELVAITSELSAKAKPGELRYGDAGPFNALAVDSLTGIGTFLETAVKKLKSWDMIWDSAPGAGKDPRSAYPYIAERGRQIVTKLMDLPVPLVMTCREGTFTEGEGQSARTYAVPELPGQKLPRELPGWPEATLRLRMLNGKRIAVTQNEGDVVARIRLRKGLRCDKYIKVDLGAIIRLLQGDATALKDLTIDTSVPKTPQQLAAEKRVAEAATVKA